MENAITPKAPRKVTLINRLGYGMGNFIGGGALSISSAWLMFFYTTYCGLKIWQATLIFAIGTYMDIFDNPIMGFITDNFNATKLGQKFGRRRFFIAISIPLMLFYPILWIRGQSFIYYILTYIMYELIYTVFNVPYKTLPVEMTEDYETRQYLSGYMSVFGKVAGFVTAALPGLCFMWLGKTNPFAYQAAVITYAILMAISAACVYFTSWEKDKSEVKIENDTEGSVFQALKKMFIDVFSTLRIRSFRWHLGMYLFGFGGEWLYSAINTYFFIFVLNRSNTFVSGINSLSNICQLVSTFVFMWICARLGRTSGAYSIALCVSIGTMIAYVVVWATGLTGVTWLILGISAIYGFVTGGVYYIPWANYGYMADVDEIVTNRRREGIYSGAQTMAGKLIRASSLVVLGWVLSATHFVEDATVQPMSAKYGLIGLLLVGVCGLQLLGMWASKHMKVNEKTQGIIVDEVARVRNGGSKADVKPEVKAVVEELTGFKYEDCFGNNNVGYHNKHKKNDKLNLKSV